MSIHEALDWYQSLGSDVDYKIESNKNAFAVLLNAMLIEQGINKADFASRINKSAPYVSKVLRGEENLTIATMTKLLDAVGCDLHINACQDGQDMKWFRTIQGHGFASGRSDQSDPDRNRLSKVWAEKMSRDREVA